MKNENVAAEHNKCHIIWACNHESGLHQGWSGTPVSQISNAPKNERNPKKNQGEYFISDGFLKFGINAGVK